VVYAEFVGMFMIYTRTKFYITNSSVALIVLNQTVKCFTFYKNYLTTCCIYFEDVVLRTILGSCI